MPALRGGRRGSLDTIAAPEIDITSGEDDGPFAFDAVVEIRPKVSIAGYEGLVVTLPSLEASELEITARIDRLRSNLPSSARSTDLLETGTSSPLTSAGFAPARLPRG